MTQENLKQLYSRQNWQAWLADIFGAQMQFEEQADEVEVDRANIKSVYRFAAVQLVGGKNLAVLDVETCAGVQIFRNRVGLHSLVKTFIDRKRYHGILAFYHSDTSAEYRMSFISSESKFDEAGNYVLDETASKRYTYVLGENAKTKTPSDRLKNIADKNGKATLEDVKNAFSVETLTKEFYNELSNWYFWALQNVDFPAGEQQTKEINNSTSVIRLITRLIFVWFLKQKKLIANELFDTRELAGMLNYSDKTGSTFYKAILQNLFFATLNNEMGEKRTFIKRQYGVQNYYRYERFFKNKERFLELTKGTPFLNGGLFENLDKFVGNEKEERIDCFSNRADKEQLLKVPDFLFFGEEKQTDLNKIYDTRGKTYKVRGLIDILNTYNFTIEENTPIDVEVALDPELLGKVFENLLASYNPETQTTARKQTGSFYTPREIVDYMVDESLSAYLQAKVGADWEDNVQTISALNEIKILDPACGSGAFPMGILKKMVQILQKLDPKNELWKQRQLDIARQIEDNNAREVAITNIEEAFENNELDYGRKLFLIENSIFGIDIQPIAAQISKLRFFISLICEQTPNAEKPNLGIRPLPNLETKFVAANTLIGLEKPEQIVFGMEAVEPLVKKLADVRHKHFSARTPQTKEKCRKDDEELRLQISRKLKEIGFTADAADKISGWNPYDQNANADWFDMEWMFGVKAGFDVVIGNPPYVKIQDQSKIYSELFGYSADLLIFFSEKSLQLMKCNGILSFIVSNKWLKTNYGKNIREKFKSTQQILVLIDFQGVKIFESADVDSSIFVVKNNNNNNNFLTQIGDDNYSFYDFNRKKNVVIPEFKINIKQTFDDIYVTESSVLPFYFKMQQKKSNISVHMTKGLSTGNDDIYLLEFRNKIDDNLIICYSKFKKQEIKIEKSILTNYIQGEDLGLLQTKKSKKLFLLLPYLENGNLIAINLLKTDFPNAFEYLNSCKSELLKRKSVRLNESDWYKFSAMRNFETYRTPKILISDLISKGMKILHDENNYFHNASIHNIPFETLKIKNIDEKFLIGLFISKVFLFYNKIVGEKLATASRIIPKNVEQFPIPNISPFLQLPITTLVNQILSAKQQNPQADTSALESEIDSLVYALYNLTEEEINVIEHH